ncbi:MAG TPA: hypothetical protein VII83_09195 [Gaiellaceae bacterium]
MRTSYAYGFALETSLLFRCPLSDRIDPETLGQKALSAGIGNCPQGI